MKNAKGYILKPRYWLINILSVVLLCTSCATQTSAKETPSLYQANEKAVVKFHQGKPRKFNLDADPLGDYPVVNVAINGIGNFKLLLDTGFSNLGLFNTDKVAALNLKTDGKFSVKGAGKGKIIADIAAPVVIDFGEATIEGLRPIILPESSSPFADTASAPFDGAIGWDLLSHFVWSVSDGGKSIALIPHQVANTDLHDVVKTIEVKDRDLLIDIDLKPANNLVQFTVKATLDTGYNGVLTLNTSLYPDINKAPQGGYSSTSHITGKSLKQNAQVKSLQLGKYEFFDVVVTQGDSSTLLGSELLNRFDYTIDLPNRELRLKSRTSTFDTFSNGTFHAAPRPTKNGGCEVSAVIENGVAWQAGLRPGMAITKLGDDIKEPCSWQGLFSRKTYTGDKINICFVDGEKNEQCALLTAQDKMFGFETNTAKHEITAAVLIAKKDGWQLLTSKDGEAVFQGKLNDESVDAIIRYFEDVGATNNQLVIQSTGGDTLAAIKLGKFIHQHKISLHVDRFCVSGCLYFVLPAAPKVTFSNNAIVAMHKAPSNRYFQMQEFIWNHEKTKNNPAISEEKRLSQLAKIAKEKQTLLPEIEGFYSELGLPKDALSNVTKMHSLVKKGLKKDGQDKAILSKAAIVPDSGFLAECLGFNTSDWPDYSQTELDDIAQKSKTPMAALFQNKLIFEGRVIFKYNLKNCQQN